MSQALLPYMEQANISNRLDTNFPINATVNMPYLQTIVPSFICPTDPGLSIFELGEDTGVDEDAEEGQPGHNIDLGPKLFRIAKSNYVGVFGTLEIDSFPYKGDGVFFGNSNIRLQDLVDGVSNTIIFGERSSKLGGSLWHGYILGAAGAPARFLGSTDHVPNSPVGHFDDFSSYHSGGTHFIFGDCSTKFVSNNIDLGVYQSLATRAGGEVPKSID